jgi:hypothetical protein
MFQYGLAHNVESCISTIGAGFGKSSKIAIKLTLAVELLSGKGLTVVAVVKNLFERCGQELKSHGRQDFPTSLFTFLRSRNFL